MSESASFGGQSAPPLPQRWQASLRNLSGAKADVQRLQRALSDAIFLDEDEWRRAVPVHQLNSTIQAQQRRVRQMERALGEMRARLEASEAGRREAEARAKQLASDLEDSTRVFRLHYDAIIEKDKEIEGLREAIKALVADRGNDEGGHEEGGGGAGEGGAGGGTSPTSSRSAPPPASLRRDWLGAGEDHASGEAPGAVASAASTAQPTAARSWLTPNASSARSWMDDTRPDAPGWGGNGGNAYRIVSTGSLGGASGDEDEGGTPDDDSLLGSDGI